MMGNKVFKALTAVAAAAAAVWLLPKGKRKWRYAPFRREKVCPASGNGQG